MLRDESFIMELFQTRPEHVFLVLPVALGFMIAADSVFKLQLALELRGMGAYRWKIMPINVEGTIE